MCECNICGRPGWIWLLQAAWLDLVALGGPAVALGGPTGFGCFGRPGWIWLLWAAPLYIYTSRFLRKGVQQGAQCTVSFSALVLSWCSFVVVLPLP